VVDGWRETAQAIQAGLKLCGIYLPESRTTAAEVSVDPAIASILEQSEASGKITWVSDSILPKISYGQSPRGVVAEFEQPAVSLEQLQLPLSPLILILDRIEKPGNIGAVFRCADAAGVDAVLLCESCDLFNPNAIRSSLGCVFHVPSAHGTRSELESFLVSRSIRVLSARVESSTPLWSADLSGPLAVILGSESDGLGDRWRSVGGMPVEGIKIPMAGKVDSLNISVSAAVIALEASRQRKNLQVEQIDANETR
jgi:TrmH family RNA methyltransferase